MTEKNLSTKKEISEFIARKTRAMLARAQLLAAHAPMGLTGVRLCEEREAKPDPEMMSMPRDAFVGLYVKVKLTDPESLLTEHVWISCDGTKGNGLMGVVDNDTVQVKHIKCGDRISFGLDEIEELLDPKINP